MNALLATIKRDLVERRNVFIAAAFLAIIPFVASFFWRAHVMDSRDSRVATAVVLGLGLAAAVALIHGSSMLGRDLAEHRAGFYFARPLPAWSIWWGKLLGGILLVLVTPTIIILPSVLASRSADFRNEALLVVPVAAFGLVLLLAAAHAISVTLRSRSPWLIVDVIAVPTVLGVAWLLLRILQSERAKDMSARAIIGCAVGLLFALVLAGAVQTTVGRTEIRRGHRALSLTLWGALLAMLVSLGGFVHWVLNVSVADLAQPHVVSVPSQGDWLTIYGWSRQRGDYGSIFLFNPVSGKELRLTRNAYPVLFSADGRTAAWFEPSERFNLSSPQQLVTADFARPEPELRRTAVTGPGGQLALSPDGRLAAIRDGDSHTLSLVDLRQDRLLTATRVAPAYGATLAFVGAERVRLYSSISHDPTTGIYTIAIEEMTKDSPKLVRTGTMTSVTNAESFLRAATWDPVHDRLMLEERSSNWERPGIALFDARSGERLADLVLPSTVELPEATFFSDGHIAVGESIDGRARVRLLGTRGEDEHVVDLGPGVRVSLGSEPEPGRLLVFVYHRTAFDFQSASLVDLDLELRVARTASADGRPIDRDTVGDWVPRRPVPGSLSSRLLDAPGIGYGIYEPASRTVRPILQPQ